MIILCDFEPSLDVKKKKKANLLFGTHLMVIIFIFIFLHNIASSCLRLESSIFFFNWGIQQDEDFEMGASKSAEGMSFDAFC